jgi:hypothetical protein
VRQLAAPVTGGAQHDHGAGQIVALRSKREQTAEAGRRAVASSVARRAGHGCNLSPPKANSCNRSRWQKSPITASDTFARRGLRVQVPSSPRRYQGLRSRSAAVDPALGLVVTRHFLWRTLHAPHAAGFSPGCGGCWVRSIAAMTASRAWASRHQLADLPVCSERRTARHRPRLVYETAPRSLWT